MDAIQRSTIRSTCCFLVLALLGSNCIAQTTGYETLGGQSQPIGNRDAYDFFAPRPTSQAQDAPLREHAESKDGEDEPRYVAARQSQRVETKDDDLLDNGEEGEDDFDSLLDSNLEALSDAKVTTPDLNFEVTSVARNETSIARSPAAIYVITNEMIRRSGARKLVDVFRMVPGMHVARQNNSSYSIGMRGTSGTLTSDLLVQVDGRSIYNRVFGGTFWGIQDMVLEDIERVEVIRGSGGSVWGANAVRGVINIVTKDSRDTRGVFAEFAAGDELNHTETFRVGGGDDNFSYRIFGRGIEVDGGRHVDGRKEIGNWQSRQVGFRTDARGGSIFDHITWQAGVTDADYLFPINSVQPTTPFVREIADPVETRSWYTNLTGTIELSESESVKVRGSYYSFFETSVSLNLQPVAATEFDVQHNLKFGENHSVVWGANYRHTYARNVPSFQIASIPTSAYLNEYGLFVQDTISLNEKVDLTLGTKLSYNDYSQFEFQPTARVVYSPTKKLSIWGAVSRAVSTPNFKEEGAQIRLSPVATTPVAVFPRITGNSGIGATDLLSIETGLRGQPQKSFYWDLSAYHFTFRDQVTIGAFGPMVPGPVLGTFDLPAQQTNTTGTTEVGGFEYFSRLDMTEYWKLSGGYTFAHNFDAGFNFPRNSVYFQSGYDLSENTQLDLIWRYRDNFGSVSSFNTADVRLSWKPTDHAELTLAGMNLLDSNYLQAANDPLIGSIATQTQRSVYGMIQFRY